MVQEPPHYLLPTWPWRISFLGLSFLIYEVGVIVSGPMGGQGGAVQVKAHARPGI